MNMLFFGGPGVSHQGIATTNRIRSRGDLLTQCQRCERTGPDRTCADLQKTVRAGKSAGANVERDEKIPLLTPTVAIVRVEPTCDPPLKLSQSANCKS